MESILWGQAVILGIIQGATELLPISSSGHLIILPYLFHWPDQGLLFDVLLHLGTLAAVVLFLRSELHQIIKNMFVSSDAGRAYQKLGWYIILATIPAALIGWIAQDYISNTLRSPVIVAVALIFWGIVLWIADEYARRTTTAQAIPHVGLWQVLSVGLWQVLALLPGTSRSGITITGALFVGIDKSSAIKLSFLLSIPVIAGAGLVSGISLLQAPEAAQWWVLLYGFLSALISGYFALHLLLGIVRRFGFRLFVLYRILLGILLLVLYL